MLELLSTVARIVPFGHSKFARIIRDCVLKALARDNIVKTKDMILRVHSPTEFIARQILMYRAYEPEVVAVMQRVVKAGDTVLDIGANIGFHTIHLSRAVGPEGKVIAFEPDPLNLALLNENLRLNNCKNVQIIPAALGEKTGKAKLFTCEDNKGYQSFVDLAGTETFIEVNVQTAAEVLGDVQPNFAKIDVEGAEPGVLKGMSSLPPQFIFEFTPSQLSAVGFDPHSFLVGLHEDGYVISTIEKDGPKEALPDEIVIAAERTGLDYNLFAEFR